MSILLVTYDCAEIDSKVDPVLSIVKEYKHIQLSDGTYAIETDEKTRTVFNKIIPYIRSSAHLWTAPLK